MGKTEKTAGRRGFVSRHSSSVILLLNYEQIQLKENSFLAATPLQQLQSAPKQYMQKCKGSAKKLEKNNTLRGRDWIQFRLRCAQASLYPCTLLYLCSLDWQKLRVHWAKAILVNSLPFMRRVIPRLFQLSFARACRDDPRSSSLFCCRELHSRLLSSSIDLTFHVFLCVFFYRQSNEVN